MNVRGISAFFHESATALINDKNGILAATEEERFTRKKT
jgi:predicted NodU family carbamoyl transferase